MQTGDRLYATERPPILPPWVGGPSPISTLSQNSHMRCTLSRKCRSLTGLVCSTSRPGCRDRGQSPGTRQKKKKSGSKYKALRKEGALTSWSEQRPQADFYPPDESASGLWLSGQHSELSTGKQNALFCRKDVCRLHLLPRLGCESECMSNKMTGMALNAAHPSSS